jgi:hypothetical protein
MKDCQNKGRVKYLFTLDESFTYQSDIYGYRFEAPFLSVYEDGLIYIPAGYSWDGNSLKFCLVGRVVGTPDGRIDPRTGKPVTYYASLVHDALYQYILAHKIPRKQIDDLYLKMLREAEFKSAGLYYRAVRLFGGIFIKLTR